jgi:hypothetical protein
MESKSTKPKQFLLPVYFRKIGFFIIPLAVIIPIIVLKIMDIEPTHTVKNILRVCCLDIAILGLLFISLSKEKIEDEMTIYQLKSMAFAFMWVTTYVILEPLFYLLVDERHKISGQRVVISMLLVYLLMFYYQKRTR